MPNRKAPWDCRDFSEISKNEISREGNEFKVRGRCFDSLAEAEEYIYHVNLFRQPYSGPRPRVLDSKKYVWYVFGGIILAVHFLTYDPYRVEYKFESYEEAGRAGVFRDGLIPHQIPKNISYLLIRQDLETGIVWARFDADRDDINLMLSSYKSVPVDKASSIAFPTTSGYPWQGATPASLVSEFGRNQVIVGEGECAGGNGHAVLVWTGERRDTFYGCSP